MHWLLILIAWAGLGCAVCRMVFLGPGDTSSGVRSTLITVRSGRAVHRVCGRLATSLASLVLLGGCVGPPAPLPPAPVSPVPGSAPASLDGAALQRGIEDYIASQRPLLDHLRAVLVVVDGQTALEYYRHGFTADDHEHLWSVTKSVVSTLVGIALGEGLIPSLDAPLQELLPEYRSIMTSTAATVTLRQLMNHTSGLVGDPSLEFTVLTGKADPVAWALSKEEARRGPPGVFFRYSSLGSHVAAAVLYSALQRNPATKDQSILDFARTKLFDPLGITTRPATKLTDPDYDGPGFGWGRARKVHLGGWGLRLTARDMAKIGKLYLEDGMWDGTRVLPEGWVAEATTPGPVADQVGLLWWHEYEGGFAARGFEGQRIVVIPDKRSVIVTLCATTPDDFALDEIDYLISAVIRPALK